jgi:tRNA A-37 threonylcarbamoyl transferase component Bud32
MYEFFSALARVRLAAHRTMALLCGLLAAIASLGFGQQYPFLPVPASPKNVKVLFQDSRGRLWLGGDQLACFDGTRMLFLSEYGFPAVSSYSITEDSAGVIWIGAETGVYRFAAGRVEEISKGVAVSIVAASPDVVVAAMGPLGKGIPSDAMLARIERTGDQWKTETIMRLDSPGPLTLDHQGVLLYPWLANGWNELRLEDVVQWRPGKQLQVSRRRAADAPAAGEMKALRDRFGCVWMGSENGDTYNCGENNWPAAPYEGASVRAGLQENPDGSMMLAGYNMLAVGRPGAFRVATPANGLPQLFTAIQATDGTIWIGGAQGLYRFASPFRIEYWTAREGVDNPWSVQRSGADVYAGLNRKVAVLSKDRQRWEPIASFHNIGQVMNVLPSDDGTLTVALNPGGAAVIRRDGKILARNGNLYYGLRLAKVSNEEMWMGGVVLTRIERSGDHLNFAETYRPHNEMTGNVLDIQYEKDTRKLFACYVGGLLERNSDRSWREITTKDGLLVDACWSLAALPNGDIWYGYYNTAAFALLRPTTAGRFAVRQFRASDEVRDPESFTFDIDQRGWLWRGGTRGVSVASPAEAEAAKWLFLDQSDGLPGVGANTGSFFSDSDGSIWLGIDISIFHYLPPADLIAPGFAPKVFLSSLSWDGAAPRIAEAIAHLPQRSKVVAHIGSLQFERRNALRLRYRILPEHSSWRESSSLDLPLGSLRAGKHTLEVQARVFTGPWSGTLSQSLIVVPPLWLSWPLLLLYALAAITLMCAGYLLHRKHRAEQAELLPDLAAWRVEALLPEVHELAGILLDGRFEAGELLARGGFANVMAGYDHQRKQRCAVKVFRNEVKDKDWVQRRFDQEVAALRKVHHPNVVSIYAHGSTPSGAPYLVMEFIEGKNLREILEKGALSPTRAARFLRQIASALDAIHSLGIYHRDVKPENVIVRDEGSAEEELVLIDFSIAIVKEANEALHGLSRAAGTFAYMAPEQAIGYAEPSSDIYSLAKLVIEMLTGRSLSDLLPDAAIDLPDRVRELLPGLGTNLSQDSIHMLAKALEFDPARRPHLAEAFAHPIVHDLDSDARAARD